MGGGCPGVWVEPAPQEGGAEGEGVVGSSEIALYIGLSMAVLVFLLVVLVAISLIRRRRLPHGYALTQSGTRLRNLLHYQMLNQIDAYGIFMKKGN